MPDHRFSGVIPANLLPFDSRAAIDEPAYRRHLSWLAGVDGVEALVVNGHAAEVSSLRRDERRRALGIAAEEVGDRVELIAGVLAEGTGEAEDLARDARAEGMAGVLAFPPSLLLWGGNARPAVARAHVDAIATAAQLPAVAFQYPPASGWGYTLETLLEVAALDGVVAVKEWSQDIVVFERHLRALHALDPPVGVLSSYSASLYATFVLGADGAISGMGSVVADLQAAMFRAVAAGDHKIAAGLNDALFPLAECFYRAPFLDAHNRMKEALVQLGRLEHAVVRPPLLPLRDAERRAVAAALASAGLTARGPRRPAWPDHDTEGS